MTDLYSDYLNACVCILSLKQLIKSEMIHIRIRGYRRVSEMDFTEYFLTVNLKA